MRVEWLLFGLLLAHQNAPVGGATAAPPPDLEIYSDPSLGISVRLAQTQDRRVVINSRLPAGWSFSVDIDGDQDGMWGTGSGFPDEATKTSADRSFGQHAKTGLLCSQYIFSHHPQHPSETYVSSRCGELPSKGRAILTGYGADKRATLSFDLPADELFGDSDTARIRVCVWDTKNWNCQQRRPNLLELRRE